MGRIVEHEPVAALLDADAFAAALRPYWIDMARLSRALAPDGQWEDVLQDALGVAWRRRDGFTSPAARCGLGC